MACTLWGSRTKDTEKRSFSGYTYFPYKAEIYSLKDWQQSGYGVGGVCKVDEPVSMCIDFCKKYNNYDTVLVLYDEYINYCKMCCIDLEPLKESR